MTGTTRAAVVRRKPTWEVRHGFRSSAAGARGGYVPQSRDIRGIGTSFKITPEMSSPMNKGPSGIRDPTVCKP